MWKGTLQPSSLVENILEGYCLPFTSPPPVSLPTAASYTVLHDPVHVQVVDEEVATMLEKGAIKEISPSPGFYSLVFWVPKKDRGLRPIINLKKFNKNYLDPPHFRMDTIKDLILLLQEGDWAASVDLRDAYFHVGVNRRLRRFLRFGWKKRLYQYLLLPFGLCLAPFVFTMLTKPIVAYLRSRTIFYLDDILVLGSSQEECLANLNLVLQLLQSLGFLINWKKSSLTASQHFCFLGLTWDTRTGEVGLEEVKRLRLRQRASAALSSPPSCHSLRILLGHITAAMEAVPLICLHSRFLQRNFIAVFRSEQDRRLLVPLSQESIQALSWIASLEPHQCVAPMWPLQMETCNLEVATDASDSGWGIHYNGNLFQGRWPVDAPLHINARELHTLLIFLRDYLPPSLTGKSILWHTDSSTAIAYIRKEGGTVSLVLLGIAAEILLHRRQLRVRPVFLPSEENLLADAASRFQVLPDWHLHSNLFQQFVRRWGLPEIDLFATHLSAHLDRFFAWGQSQEAEGFDALAQEWNFLLAYAFPPPAIIPRTLMKISLSPGKFILITPFCRAQKWFPLLPNLNVVDLRRLPSLPDQVIDLTTGKPPSSLSHLRLVAWMIISGFAGSLSDPVFRLITDGWRKSTSKRYDAIWRKFKDFLSCQRSFSRFR